MFLTGILKIFQNCLPPNRKVKKIRSTLQCTLRIKNYVTSWQKALNNASISEDKVRQAHKFATSKTLLPQFHDRKFGLLCRKIEFKNQFKNTKTMFLLTVTGA